CPRVLLLHRWPASVDGGAACCCERIPERVILTTPTSELLVHPAGCPPVFGADDPRSAGVVEPSSRPPCEGDLFKVGDVHAAAERLRESHPVWGEHGPEFVRVDECVRVDEADEVVACRLFDELVAGRSTEERFPNLGR